MFSPEVPKGRGAKYHALRRDSLWLKAGESRGRVSSRRWLSNRFGCVQNLSHIVSYVERGFRSELTDFPAAAFEASLEVGELTTTPPLLVEQYGEPIEPSENEDASAFARTNMAHLWLLRFETQFRQFIDVRMTQAYGAIWRLFGKSRINSSIPKPLPWLVAKNGRFAPFFCSIHAY